MNEIELLDSTGSLTLPEMETSLIEQIIEAAQDVQTLDFNIYTSTTGTNKRVWQHTWAYMDEDVFNALKGYYDRQFTLYAYPAVTIAQLGVENIIVRMTLTPRQVIDGCGTVQGVTVTFRETRQLPAS